MGQSLSNIFHYFVGKEEVRILMVGLDGAGKTTIVYRMKLGEQITTIPTIGFNVETVEYKNIRFTIWDVGGQQRIRNLWHHYYVNTAAIIFVVDSSDTLRIGEAALELHSLVERDELRHAVLLVLANKQDMPQALSVQELGTLLELHSIRQQWHVHGTCATHGSGIYDSFEYLREMLMRRKMLS